MKYMRVGMTVSGLEDIESWFSLMVNHNGIDLTLEEMNSWFERVVSDEVVISNEEIVMIANKIILQFTSVGF